MLHRYRLWIIKIVFFIIILCGAVIFNMTESNLF